MASLSDLLAYRERLLENRYSGIREFEDQNGERVVYRSDSEIAAAIAHVESEIAKAQSGSPKTIIFRTTKGL